MTITRKTRLEAEKIRLSVWRLLGFAAVMVFTYPGTGEAQRNRFCAQTTQALFAACLAEKLDDKLVKKAICINIADEADREACFDELKEERKESDELCREQRKGRLEVCKALGENRYDPNFDPALFDDPKNPTNPNPYFPLTVGNRWEYVEGSDETVTVEVLNRTKLIDGVTCIVVNDVVAENGDLVEDTDDWVAQAKNGDVYYCGEEAKDFEFFDGDDPEAPELVSIEGSFKAGRDGDKSGILFLASPTVGKVYRQEFSVGNAEDLAEVLSTTYKFGVTPELDQLVPQELADLLCAAGDCVVTKDFSPLSPESVERKYYAPGIGLFLEVKPNNGEVGAQLVDCNFNPRCASLPQP